MTEIDTMLDAVLSQHLLKACPALVQSTGLYLFVVRLLPEALRQVLCMYPGH